MFKKMYTISTVYPNELYAPFVPKIFTSYASAFQEIQDLHERRTGEKYCSFTCNKVQLPHSVDWEITTVDRTGYYLLHEWEVIWDKEEN